MEFRHLHYFLAIAEEGSFNRAAERLRISQPSLSRQVQALERELGQALFDRTARGATPTVAGEALLQHARQLLALEAATQEVVSGATEIREVVTIGVPPGTSSEWLVSMVGRLDDEVPGCALQLVEANSTNQLRMLREGRLDLCMVHQSPPSDCSSWKLREEPFGLAVRPGHTLASAESCSLRDLDGLRVLVHSRDQVPTQQDGLIGAAVEAGIRPYWQFAQFVEHALAGAAAAKADAVLVSRYTAEKQMPGWPWHPLTGLPLAMTTWLVCQRHTRAVVGDVTTAIMS
ncbi:LysR family transcriptional regulator [Rhodococcus opacus]|uniref:LysR family transcriptional regulator n=1 Tax=Rhodococcus opacus TaxID=37919 RepID=UPI00215836DB|nr:LysR family transcriptional regulator [Rhodococcus opacus]UOT03183.2 LysR family transcriptional regulator [Rhodococcus opacus]